MRSNQATLDTASRAGWIGYTLPAAGSWSIRRLLRSYSRRGLRPLYPKMAKVESLVTPTPANNDGQRQTNLRVGARVLGSATHVRPGVNKPLGSSRFLVLSQAAAKWSPKSPAEHRRARCGSRAAATALPAFVRHSGCGML